MVSQYAMNEKNLVIHKVFFEISSGSPDRVCLQTKKACNWERWTYGQVEDLSRGIGAFLIKEGFKKGDFAAICMENRPEWAVIYLGIMSAGLTCVPLDPQLLEQEIENLIKDCGSKIIFVSKTFLETKDISKIMILPVKIVVSDLDVEKEGLIGFGQVTATLSEGVQGPEVFPEDAASLIYTSGTTGKPKGVILSHKNFCCDFQSIDRLKLFSEKDNLISILPLHHAYPFMVMLITPLFCRARVTYTSSLRIDELLELMRETGVTVMVGVPQIFFMLYKNISEKMRKIPFLLRAPLSLMVEILWQIRRFSGINLSKIALSGVHRPFGRHLRFFACGGAKLNGESEKYLVKIGFTVLGGYGLTETSPVVAFNPIQRQKTGSAGRAVPGVELKIDEADAEGVGEVLIKGPNVMKGYYKRPEDTLNVIKDDWFYSGDLGRIDQDGYLYITGRKKEMIVLSSGKNIYPEEIESYYAASPFIKEICVLSSEREDEVKLRAVIVPDIDYCRKSGEVDITSAVKWSLENLSAGLPSYKRIKGYVLTKDEIPRTRMGKIKRFQVEEKYLNELNGEKPEDDTELRPSGDEFLTLISSETGRKVIDELRKFTKPGRQISSGDHLELDLGIDSLGRVELMAALEQALNIRLTNDLVARVFFVKDLILEIEKMVLPETDRKDSVPAMESQSLWRELLNERPSEDAVKKISLTPNLATIFGMLIFTGILRFVFSVIWPIRVSGIENIPKGGKYILCVNHSSYLDAFIVEASMPRSSRKDLFFVGFKAYFEPLLIRSLVKYIRVIPIDAGTRFVEAMQASSYVLKSGKIVCIFPEGQRSIDGNIKNFKKGCAILAKELKVALVPVLITGAYESWPRTKSFPRPHPIGIAFGMPFSFEELKEEGLRLGTKDEYEAVAAGIRQEVIKLK